MPIAIFVLGSHDASAVHSDILVVRDAQGKLVIGSADFDNNNVLSAPSRLFHRELDTNFFGSDPGFNAVSQANVPGDFFALPGNASLGFDFAALSLYGQTVANLWYWDGADANENGDYLDDVHFEPAIAATLTARITPFSAVVDGTANDVAGFNLQTTSATGGMHRHANFQLAAAVGAPAQGLYLLSMRVRMDGLAKSDPLFLILATDDASVAPYYPAGVAWAEEHLLVPGDVNTDATVNIFDVNLVSAHWGQQGPTGDANYDGVVNIFDINLISANWNAAAVTASSSSAMATVPEPASWMLLVAGLFAWRVRCGSAGSGPRRQMLARQKSSLRGT